MKKAAEYFVVKHPWTIIALFIIASIAAIYGNKNLYFRGDYKVFFEETYGPAQDFEEMQKVFTKTENVAVLILPGSGEVVSKDSLTLIENFTDDAWQIPYSSRVDSLTNYQYSWAEYDDMIVENLVEDIPSLTQEDLDRIYSISMKEQGIKGNLLSEDGRATMVNVALQLPETLDNTKIVFEIKEYVDDIIAKYQEQYPDAEFHMTGVVPMNYALAKEARKDITTLVPAMLVIVILLIGVMIRSFLATLAISIVLILSIGATMGIAGWMGYFLSVATVNVPIVVFIIGVADCVHMAASMQYAQRQGKTREEAVLYSLDLNWSPIFITSATTAVGFSSLMLSDSPVFVDFGLLCAIGVTICYLMSIFFFAALMKVLPVKLAGKDEKPSVFMENFAEFVIKYQKMLLVGGVVVVGTLSAMAFRNELNDVAMEYFAESTEFYQAASTQDENLSGISRIYWALYTGESGGISEPDFIRTMDTFQQWLSQQPEVDHVSSLADTYKRLNKNMHGDDESWYRIPDNRELAAQYLLLYEMSLPYGLDLNNQIDIDKSAVRMTSILKNIGSKEIIELETRATQWFEENTDGIRLAVAGPPLMFSHIGQTNMRSMIQSMAIAMVVISGILIFALKSLRLGVISLLPNIAPALVGFGIWSFISGYISLGLSIVASMTLGIIVDDCVHFLSKYKRAREDGLSSEDAIRYAFVSVGRALVITTVVLSIGFCILLFSSFSLNAEMGAATTLVITSALVVDFLLLPPLLLWLDKAKTGTGKSSNMAP